MKVRDILKSSQFVEYTDAGMAHRLEIQNALDQFVAFESTVFAFQAFSRVTGWNGADVLHNPEYLPRIMTGLGVLAENVKTYGIEMDREAASTALRTLATKLFTFLPQK